MRGWHRESQRHALAARGIKTISHGIPRKYSKVGMDIPYYDIEQDIGIAYTDVRFGDVQSAHDHVKKALGDLNKHIKKEKKRGGMDVGPLYLAELLDFVLERLKWVLKNKDHTYERLQIIAGNLQMIEELLNSDIESEG